MTSVLVVDDSRLARRVALGILERIRPGWSAVEAADAEEAMSAIRERSVDIVLLDINMPGTDGLTLAQRIRADSPGIAVAIVSANIQDAVVARARAMGATFLAKPLTEEALAPFLDGATLLRKRAASRNASAGPPE